MPEHHRVDSITEITEKFRDEISDFFKKPFFHETRNNQGVQLSRIHGTIALVIVPVLPEQIGGQDMLARKQMPKGECMTCVCITPVQTAQSADGRADSHVPVHREFPAAAVLSDHFDTLRGQRPDFFDAAFDEHRVAQQTAAEQEQVRDPDKITEQGLFHTGEAFGIPGDISRRVNAEEHDVVALCVQFDLELFCLLVDLLNAQRAADQLFKKSAPGIILVLSGLPCEGLQIFLLILFLFNPFFRLLERFDCVCLCNWLEKVLIDLQLDCLLGIFKIVITGKDDDPGIRQFPVYQPAQRQAVHKGHLDIRNQDIRTDSAYHGQGDLSVLRLAGKDKTVLFPRDHIPQTFPDDALIFNKKHFNRIHTFSPVKNSGDRTRTVFDLRIFLVPPLPQNRTGITPRDSQWDRAGTWAGCRRYPARQGT